MTGRDAARAAAVRALANHRGVIRSLSAQQRCEIVETEAPNVETAAPETEVPPGWTVEALNKYRAERDAAHPLVAGNVVTSFKRPKPAAYLIGAKSFNPHKW